MLIDQFGLLLHCFIAGFLSMISKKTRVQSRCLFLSCFSTSFIEDGSITEFHCNIVGSSSSIATDSILKNQFRVAKDNQELAEKDLPMAKEQILGVGWLVNDVLSSKEEQFRCSFVDDLNMNMETVLTEMIFRQCI